MKELYADLQEWLRTDPAEFNDALRDAMADDTGTRWRKRERDVCLRCHLPRTVLGELDGLPPEEKESEFTPV